MKGNVKVSYKVLCGKEINQEMPLSDLLANANVKKAIKSAFTHGRKEIVISFDEDVQILIEPQRPIYEMTIMKDDVQDMLTLAEEDAKKHKRSKKACEQIEIVDFETE